MGFYKKCSTLVKLTVFAILLPALYINSTCAQESDFVPAITPKKPFKRVLVLSGGGLAPGIPLGIIAGLASHGWLPDLVIGTCGSGLGAAIFNSEQRIDKAFDVVTSKASFQSYKNTVVVTSNLLDIQSMLEAGNDTSKYPPLFSKTLLWTPEYYPAPLTTRQFRFGNHETRALIVGAQALFGPKDEGKQRKNSPLFRQVYFTDSDTAQYLQNYQLPAGKAYPVTTLTRDTATIVGYDLLGAARAGLADPFLLNPLLVQGHYHFTGAIDLYPLDLAEMLGEEVIATYPIKLFDDYQDDAINAAFGFRQTHRLLEAIQHKNEKWIDVSEDDDIIFDPKRFLLEIYSGVPDSHIDFKLGVGKQWRFGYDRAVEALAWAPGKTTNVRGHLRHPINPALKNDFSCKNAWEWETDEVDVCTSDQKPGCNRLKAKYCHPLR